MKIQKLEIENVRNLDRATIDLSNDLVVIYGKNAQGKTNLLEAIYFLAITKSPRKGKDKETINKNKKQARIRGVFNNRDGEVLEIEFLLGSKKTGKLNNRVERMRNIIGQALVVMFSADDLGIIENPQKRRRFIDILISFLDKAYFINLVEFKAAVKRRNKLLVLIKQQRADKKELFFWDEKISILAEKIIKKRKAIFKKTNNHLGKSKFFGKRKIKVEYIPQAQSKEEIQTLLLKNQEKDIILGQTTVGPHRDQINFFVGDLNLETHGSRGEKRSTAIELKKAEIEILNEELGEIPILLLDDVFSELDKENKKHVLALVGDQQTIITTTDKKDLGDLLGKACLYKLEQGKIIAKE